VKITEQAAPRCNPQAAAEKEGVIVEKTNEGLSANHSRSGFQGFCAVLQALIKVLVRDQHDGAKPSLTLEEFHQKCREAGLQLAEERKAARTSQVPYHTIPEVDSDQYFENLAKTYHYRRPWFPQIRDYRKHPILSKLFEHYLTLSFLLAPLRDHCRRIIARKNGKKKAGGAA